jgi:hypothetical protein
LTTNVHDVRIGRAGNDETTRLREGGEFMSFQIRALLVVLGAVAAAALNGGFPWI